MIALNVSDIRSFMAHLLIRQTFDDFCLSEGFLTTFCTFTIDGSWQRAFLDPEEKDPACDRKYVAWSEVREYFLSLIRGRHTPLNFKFVFLLPEDKKISLLEEGGIKIDPAEINGLFLNISFRDGHLLLTTGSSMRTFSMDRSVDRLWDTYIEEMLKEKGLAAERL